MGAIIFGYMVRMQAEKSPVFKKKGGSRQAVVPGQIFLADNNP